MKHNYDAVMDFIYFLVIYFLLFFLVCSFDKWVIESAHSSIYSFVICSLINAVILFSVSKILIKGLITNSLQAVACLFSVILIDGYWFSSIEDVFALFIGITNILFSILPLVSYLQKQNNYQK